MRIFLSAGEPSGDLHGANLVRCLRERRPDLDFVGFGGDRLARAGCQLLYPLCELAVVGFVRVLAPDQAFDAVRKAFYLAKLESRPVMLSAPMDIQQLSMDDDEEYQPSAQFFASERVQPNPHTAQGFD